MSHMVIKEKNMLNDTQLETVAGGDAVVGGCRFSGPVGMYSAVVGQWYYIVWNDGRWSYGRLYRTAEEDRWCGACTQRVHYFDITITNGKEEYSNRWMNGEDVQLYTTMTPVLHGPNSTIG